MLQRITKAKDGAAEYLANGKRSMGMHRSAYDKRVMIEGGDIHLLQQTTKMVNTSYKDWESSYRHFSWSFSPKDEAWVSKMSEAKRSELYDAITKSFLSKMFPHRDREDLIYAAEAHEPIGDVKAFSKRTGKQEARKNHIHCVVSNYDQVTKNKLEMVGGLDNLNAIQSEVCAEFGLEDPAFSAKIKKKEHAKKKLNDKEKVLELISMQRPQSMKELRKILMSTGKVKSLRFVNNLGKGNTVPYVVINWNDKVKGARKTARLSDEDSMKLLTPLYLDQKAKLDAMGREFHKEHVKHDIFKDDTKVVDNCPPDVCQKLQAKYAKKIKTEYYSDSAEGREMIAKDPELRAKLMEDAKRKLLNKTPVYYDHDEGVYVQHRKLANQAAFDNYSDWRKQAYLDRKFSREQRNFYAVYKRNISKNLIDDFKIFNDKNDEGVLVFHNKAMKMTFCDTGDMISTRTALSIRPPEEQQRAARIMIETALAKGWSLDELEATGSAGFKQVTQDLINDYKAAEELGISIDEYLENKSAYANIPTESSSIEGKVAELQKMLQKEKASANQQMTGNNKVLIYKEHISKHKPIPTLITVAKKSRAMSSVAEYNAKNIEAQRQAEFRRRAQLAKEKEKEELAKKEKQKQFFNKANGGIKGQTIKRYLQDNNINLSNIKGGLHKDGGVYLVISGGKKLRPVDFTREIFQCDMKEVNQHCRKMLELQAALEAENKKLKLEPQQAESEKKAATLLAEEQEQQEIEAAASEIPSIKEVNEVESLEEKYDIMRKSYLTSLRDRAKEIPDVKESGASHVEAMVRLALYDMAEYEILDSGRHSKFLNDIYLEDEEEGSKILDGQVLSLTQRNYRIWDATMEWIHDSDFEKNSPEQLERELHDSLVKQLRTYKGYRDHENSIYYEQEAERLVPTVIGLGELYLKMGQHPKFKENEKTLQMLLKFDGINDAMRYKTGLDVKAPHEIELEIMEIEGDVPEPTRSPKFMTPFDGFKRYTY
ncbi:hypothetical protein [Vibrio crassostreae]|uniref:hypothetical protein n=1 Tax=Vibrio crassostreae TaxID=246167 RepID=UPI001B311FFD|nr:hypothetical protein [Vibrio crassostreae]